MFPLLMFAKPNGSSFEVDGVIRATKSPAALTPVFVGSRAFCGGVWMFSSKQRVKVALLLLRRCGCTRRCYSDD